MATLVTITLGGPAVLAVGWRLVCPTRAAIEAATADHTATRAPRKPSRPRHRDTDSYAEAVNFTTEVDNDVRTSDSYDEDEAAWR